MANNIGTRFRDRLFSSDTLLTAPLSSGESIHLYREVRAISDAIKSQNNQSLHDISKDIREACQQYLLCGTKSRADRAIAAKRSVIKANLVKGCILTREDEGRKPARPSRSNRKAYEDGYPYVDLDMYISKSMNNAANFLRVDQENDNIILRTLQDEPHSFGWYNAQSQDRSTLQVTNRRMLVFHSHPAKPRT